MRYIYIVAAFVFLGLGLVGIAVPVLPTTPFLLLSVACFSRGSQRLHQWFASTKIYQKHVAEFIETHSLSRVAKIHILSISTLFILISLFTVDILWVRILLVVVSIYKYYYFYAKIKTK